MKFDIQALDLSIEKELQNKIDFKTKPIGSLGILEKTALQIGCIQNNLNPCILKPTIVVFAGDHGVVKNYPVSPFPQEVTSQMVLNFLQGGAAINVFSKLNILDLKIVDAGVNFEFKPHIDLIDAKIAKGTRDHTTSMAMTLEQCEDAMSKAAKITTEIYKNGTNTIGFGEMGIGNTSAAALLMSSFTGIPIEECTGKGTGHTDQGVLEKIKTLKKAQLLHDTDKNPIKILANYGGFEIAMLTGAILQAAHLKMTVLIDGFIVSSALLAAYAQNKHVLDYCIFSHTSKEQAHIKMLGFLKAKTILNLGLGLGEGTGVALAMPILDASVTFLNKMASFKSASVSNI